ncbi:hypothetical protein [Ferruginibacter sp. SUN106]|uniref:hypothetical protein n=1 Tax=Ferruginibacter sp. SUN106 TaxID=2978348 RepID=UPI003D35B31B
MASNWLHKILSHEVAPPEQAWVNITNELDNENEPISGDLKTKMLAHEATPPIGALTNIFNALDKEDNQSAPAYIERIKNHTEPAPVAAWSNIIAELDKEEAKIVPLHSASRKLRSIYLRVAAAAAVVAIILWAILPLAKKTQPVDEPVATGSLKNATEQTAQTNSTTNNTIADTQKITPVKAGIANNQPKEINIQKGVNNLQDYIQGNQVADLAQVPSGSSKEKLQNSKGEIPMDIALMNTPNTYISITGADGQTVKVSSKFSNLIGYLVEGNPDTQENIDVIIEESAIWRKTFAEWRDKMTYNTVALSFSNFMDIIELSKILEEKNK